MDYPYTIVISTKYFWKAIIYPTANHRNSKGAILFTRIFRNYLPDMYANKGQSSKADRDGK